MIPRLKPTNGIQEIIAALLSQKKGEIERFEADFATLMGHKHAIAFPYGRTGLTLLLEAMGLSGREIICPSYTCVVVPHAIVTSGNEPVFIDSQEHDFNMNLTMAGKAINDNTGAIIPTSIHGYPVDLDALADIKERHPDLPVIQDCAHSFAAEWKGRPVQKAGDAAIYGLNISKLVHSIFGGMVGTDRDDIADKLRNLRDQRLKAPDWSKAWRRRLYLACVYPTFNGTVYGLINRLERSGLLNHFVKYYDESIIDMPNDYLVGMTDAEARVGRVQLRRYHQIIEGRRAMANYYDQQLRDTPDLLLPPLVEGATYHHYVIRTQFKRQLLAFALQRGVQLGDLIDYSCADMKSYKGRPGNRFPCPLAADIANTTVNLPVWGNLSRQQEKIVHCVRNFPQFSTPVQPKPA
jgi:perosamine synthetase